MGTVIHGMGSRVEKAPLPSVLMAMLPPRLGEELAREARTCGPIEELRLRRGRCSSLTTSRGNRLLRTVLSNEELDTLVQRICDGSLYAHRDSIARGYVTLSGGIRVGICGRATVENDRVIGVYEISGLNIRLPVRMERLGAGLCRRLRDRHEGMLIYAPPGEGKTTLLRCIAAQMASGQAPLRVAVVDTRGELGFSLEASGLCVDILTGYPRGLGIEIATRTMNAQLIVCDEIGDMEEARAILSAQSCGVPLVASAHADSVIGLLRRSGLEPLHRARIFGSYVGIRRPVGGGEFHYTVTEWEAANGSLQADRNFVACP